MPQGNAVLIIVFVLFAIITLLVLAFFAKLFGLWLQAFLARAQVSLPSLVLMHLRRSPVKEIVHSKIMAVQAGVSIPTHKIESAALAGADLERAVLVLIRARETSTEVTWEEVISQDMSDQLRSELFPDEHAG